MTRMRPFLCVLAAVGVWMQVDVGKSATLRSFPQPPEWDVSKQGPLYLHVVAKNYTIPSAYEEFDAGTWLTRVLCWGNSSDLSDIDQDTSCGIPGPTIVLHPNEEVQNVVLVNNLVGIGHDTNSPPLEDYHDPDVINLHVHGLNVYPHVDDVVDIWLDPICCDGSQCINCNDASNPDTHNYNYTIHRTHYPGTHWYHGHWHGSTALHVNGGFYGVIKMEANDEITDVQCYEPQVKEGNDLVVEASFLWLNTNGECSGLIDNNTATCSNQGGKFGNSNHFPKYLYPAGVSPFKFALEGWCWILCKYKNSLTASVVDQYDNSQIHYDVTFDPNGNWSDLTRVQTFLINGVAEPTLQMTTGEWYRLRLLNTNMAYLIWQINDEDDEDTNFLAAVQADTCQTYLISYDGVYFDDGPRDVFDSPYSGSIVLPPGGRADVMVACFTPGTYTVISSNNTRPDLNNNLFANAPVPNFVAKVMDIVVTGETITNTSEYAPRDVSDCTSNGYNKTQLIYGEGSSGGVGYLPDTFINKEMWSPYLTDTQGLYYPDVTSYCQTEFNTDHPNPDIGLMNQCNIVLQHKIPGAGGSPSTVAPQKLSVNHIPFNHSVPLLNLATNITHEWLVTSNFHQFHQHIWPFQIQTPIVGGWLAQAGEWRDVVGAPGSYIARSNFYGSNIEGTEYYDDFFTGKLIQHCHFVPHEDHGLMAYHELMDPSVVKSYSDTPIIPVATGNNDFSISYEPDRKKWVNDSDCDEFLGVSAVYIVDSSTIIIWYFRQFTYQGYCFFGYLPIVVFRYGQVTNAFLGLGLWGSYQNNWQSTEMSGRALVFTLQHSANYSDCTLCDLEEIYVSEVELDSLNHDFSYPLGSTNDPQTPTKCSDIASGGSLNGTNQQYRYWYCVRPKTIDDYPNTTFNPYDYEYAQGKSTDEAFGYIYAYGEGQFYSRTMHASRGSCGMFFTFEDFENLSSADFEDLEDEVQATAFGCFQEGQIINTTSGQSVIFNTTTLDVSFVDVDKETFITRSGFNINATDSPTMAPTGAPTTSTSTRNYQVRMKTNAVAIPPNFYIALSDHGSIYSDYIKLTDYLSSTSSSRQTFNVTSSIDFGDAGNINYIKFAWDKNEQINIDIRILNVDNKCNRDCNPTQSTYALKSYSKTCNDDQDCCISTCTFNNANQNCGDEEFNSTCIGLPFPPRIYQVRINVNGVALPSNLYIALSNDGTTYSDFIELGSQLSATNGRQIIYVNSSINFGDAGNINYVKFAWDEGSSIDIDIRIMNQDDSCNRNCDPPTSTYAIKSYTKTCASDCCVSTCTFNSDKDCGSENFQESCVGLPFGNDVVTNPDDTTQEPVIMTMTTGESDESGDDDADIGSMVHLKYSWLISTIFIITTIYVVFN